jgi:putative nucleotidyltransferase with HDIG domain
MLFRTTIFSSKISRRIFATFVTCALTPVLCLAVLAYFQVTRHLQDQTVDSLRHAAKSQARTLFERLDFAEKELEFISFNILSHTIDSPRGLDAKVHNRILKWFKSITLFADPHHPQPILNRLALQSLPLEADDIAHLSGGHTLLVEMRLRQSEPSILILRLVDAERSDRGYLVAEINLDNFWVADEINDLPMDTELCILNSSDNILYSSRPDPSDIAGIFKANTQSSTSGHFEFAAGGGQYFAVYSQLFLKPNYKLPHWAVILFKAKSDVFAPLTEFKLIFPLFVMLTLMVVTWLSIASIRRNMVPVGALKAGVRQIAQRNFGHRVCVSSNDEFEELAVAFNEMSAALENKFKTLSTKADIDRAVLSTLNREEIIMLAVTGMAECVACHVYGISLVDSGPGPRGQALYCFESQPETILTQPVEVTSHERDVLAKNSDFFKAYPGKSNLHFIPAALKMEIQALLILPVWVGEKLSAVLWLGLKDFNQLTADDITLARQLADQIAVALSNSDLVRELKELNWGTLEALARTVDAKSHWTAGHSQRVTEMAIKIGSVLQLKPAALDSLQRAALLHDIGKVGIPSAILDKPSRLSDEEFRIIKRHPEIGAKIVKPIRAYQEITPIIAQHHERFDGKGYPMGLAGEEIDQGARIIAAADVYDALSSDRPYRKGWEIGKIIELIQAEAGRQFDPVVAKALCEVIAQDQRKAA